MLHQVRNLDKEKDWFRDLEIEVKNVSDKPIYFISLGLEFPDIQAPPPPIREDGRKLEGSVIGFTLTFGNLELGDLMKLATPGDVALKPGETYVFTIPEPKAVGFESMKKRMKFSPEATNNIRVRFDTISFGDGTGFEGSGFGGKRDYRNRIPKKQPSDNRVF